MPAETPIGTMRDVKRIDAELLIPGRCEPVRPGLCVCHVHFLGMRTLDVTEVATPIAA